MQETLHLPDDLMQLTGMASPGRAAIAALTRALAAHTPPADPDAGARATTVYVTDEVRSALLQAGATVATLPGLASGLIHAWAVLARKHAQARGTTADWGDVDADALRPQQRTLVTQVVPLLAQHRIVFQEASTGVGKSRALATLAHVRCRAGDQVTLATPTVALMAQLVEEFVTLGLPPPAIYLGRRHFVDALRLTDVLADYDVEIPENERTAAANWDGTPVPGSPTTRLAAHTPELRWMIEDLRALAPSIPMDAVSAEDTEHEAYDALREAWFAAPIRITTHSFLAADMRLAVFNKPMVDAYGCLLIDEAHLFEESVSNAFSSQLSLHSLRSWARRTLRDQAPLLRKHRALQATERVADLCDSALHDLAAHVDAGHHLVRRAGGDTSPTERYLGESLRVCCEALKKDVTRILDVPLANLGPVRDAMAACTLTLGNNPILVQLSPQRRYPSILVGPRGLGTALRGLWERTERAALLSGTLLVNTGSMGDSSGYMASLLHVPGDRIADAPPIIAPWLYSTPTAHIPGAALAARLIPPRQSASGPDTEDTNGDGDAYYAALAGVIRSASQSAAGGTLVLCTSFQAIRRLEAALATITDRLIVQTPRTPLVRCEAQFRGMAAAGQRPVWLATGGAWTGLDLRDPRVPATEDHLLTDVVITRLPINPATSLHGSLRQRRTGLAMMRLDVALRFRQGMGRLVRAEGQPDRRLWICDGRMWSSVAPHPHLTGPSKRALMVYPARAEF